MNSFCKTCLGVFLVLLLLFVLVPLTVVDGTSDNAVSGPAITELPIPPPLPPGPPPPKPPEVLAA